MNVYLWCALALLLGLVPLGWVMLRAAPLDALVALELGGIVVTLTLLLLAAGFHRSSYFSVAVVSAAMTWIGGMVFVRFLSRRL